MKNKNIIVNVSKNPFEIDYDFVYNFYEDKETLTEDLFISNNKSSNQKSKFIKLSLSFKKRSFFNSEENRFISDENFSIGVSSIGNLSPNHENLSVNIFRKNIDKEFFLNLNNKKSLSIDDRALFSTFNMIDNYIYLNEDVKKSKYIELNDIEKTLKYFNSSSSNSEFLKEIKTKSNVVYYDKNYIENLITVKENSFILQNKNVDNIENYKSIIDLEVSDENINTSIVNFIPNIEKNIFNHSIIDSEFDSVFSRVNKKDKIFLGILADKFIKSDGVYEFKSSSFYFDMNSTEKETKRFNIDIIDDGIKYGSTYKYIFYPVYFYSRVTMNEGTTFTNYLICDVPSITEDIECVEKIRPPAISNLRGKYYENRKSLRLYWSMPAESQRDIKGFQIFKRNSLDEPYVLVKQLESHKKSDFYQRNINIQNEEVIVNEDMIFTEYYDETFNPTNITIYTVCSIDAHGLVSNYSEQIGFTYDFLNKKTISDLVSTPGAPIFYPNLFIPRKTIFFDNDDKIVTITPAVSNKKKFTLIFAPDCIKHNNEKEINVDQNLFKDSYELSIFRLNGRSLYEDKFNVSVKDD